MGGVVRCLAALLLLIAAPAAAAGPPEVEDWRPTLDKAPDGTPIVVLNLDPCRIREAEPRPTPANPQAAGECEALNRASLTVRERAFKRLRLPAGRYVFRVLNGTLPFAAGFEVRGALDAGLPHTRGDGIAPGTGKDFRIELKPGRYLFRCPVSPTPDYPLLVEG